MGSQLSPQERSARLVGYWILTGLFMLVIQIALGGITRLTGSGLSITEWDVITGAVPPLDASDWMREFEKYRATPQYRLLNTDFTLADFKFIYFWEWFHRLWGRLIGLVFAIGFIYFLVKKHFRRHMVAPLLALFLLGALQGVIGWIMVQSGLTGDAVYVKPTRLALHFIFAMLLIAYTLWFGLRLLVPAAEVQPQPSLRRFTWWIIVILAVQLVYGALMAGHKAATMAPTWPLINGELVPGSLFMHKPWLINFIDNKITVHFIHRNLAYLLLVLIIAWYVKARKSPGRSLFRRHRSLPLWLVLVQVLLGVLAVLNSLKIVPNQWGVFEWMAQLHQLTGMLLLLSLVYMLYLVQGRRAGS